MQGSQTPNPETGLNTTENLFPGFSEYYNRNLLEYAVPFMIHEKFGKTAPIPSNNTMFQKFRIYNLLAPNTTPLEEGITPPGKKMLPTDIIAEVKQYGDYVPYTDVVTFSNPDPVLTIAGRELGKQAGRTLDWIVRDVINAGTSVLYAGSNNTDTDEVAAGDVLTGALFQTAHLNLRLNLAEYFTSMQVGSGNVGTTPIMPAYAAITHTRVINWLKTNKSTVGFVPVSEYAYGQALLPNEQGMVDQIRICESPDAKVFEGAGTNGIDVYSTLVIGVDAYASTEINGQTLENIIKPLGFNDELNQRGSTGWKATKGAVRLKEINMVRIEHAIA